MAILFEVVLISIILLVRFSLMYNTKNMFILQPYVVIFFFDSVMVVMKWKDNTEQFWYFLVLLQELAEWPRVHQNDKL